MDSLASSLSTGAWTAFGSGWESLEASLFWCALLATILSINAPQQKSSAICISEENRQMGIVRSESDWKTCSQWSFKGLLNCYRFIEFLRSVSNEIIRRNIKTVSQYPTRHENRSNYSAPHTSIKFIYHQWQLTLVWSPDWRTDRRWHRKSLLRPPSSSTTFPALKDATFFPTSLKFLIFLFLFFWHFG